MPIDLCVVSPAQLVKEGPEQRPPRYGDFGRLNGYATGMMGYFHLDLKLHFSHGRTSQDDPVESAGYSAMGPKAPAQ